MTYNIDGFAQTLAAFLDDLGEPATAGHGGDDPQFGRRVAENGSKGFDHGWGNMMLVAGAGVKGGQYYGSWPRLDAAALAEGDLKVTTDYRNVLGEIISRRFPDRSPVPALPGPVLHAAEPHEERVGLATGRSLEPQAPGDPRSRARLSTYHPRAWSRSPGLAAGHRMPPARS